ncbi:MAG TPA: tRNA (adenosine(37)-N6)-threonylcarbamoyltransferase complex dimerization subunit type 1 TsaB [Bryobacteraceae bacterium]|nr:tRNA (adenosine(37)-N6)-threonylcarbamoyltransferase complex dimerization subunit type 1 TsaB [Bryobacteraceae bacterium]
MNILAIDTTSEFGSIALRSNGQTVAESTLNSSTGYGHLILPAVEKLLNEARLTLNQVDCFAAGSGPGAFTGVRVGLGTTKGLAEAMGKPAIGISNLRALASFGKTDRRGILLDARRGEVYAAIYNSRLELVSSETVMKRDEWLAGPGRDATEFVSQNADEPYYLASAVAYCAELDRHLWRDPAALDANYVRRSDAEQAWKEV